MSDFKVIKEFGNAEVGDVFCYDVDEECYALYYINEEAPMRETTEYVDMFLAPTIVEVLTKEGYLEEVKVEPIITPEANKLKEVTDFVYKQIENCKKDSTLIQTKFDNGEVQPCVKVESDTVHYNLLKVLNHIKDIINE